MQPTLGITVDLTPKCAVVTGAGSGIGAATAIALVGAGAKVVGVDRDADGLTQTAAATGGPDGAFRPLVLELCDDDAGRVVAATVEEAFGRLDILVHAAGIWAPEPFAAPSAQATLERQLAINLLAPHALTHAALPLLRAEGATVVFITSRSGRYTTQPVGSSGYCASKAAASALARSLAAELAADGIRVNEIAPGTIETPINRAALADPEMRRRFTETPAGRLGQVEDLAATVLFLVSDAASFYYGAAFIPDGGIGVIS